MTNSVAVIIPVYKEALDYYEELSLKQCLKVFQHYPIIFVAPTSLKVNQYASIREDNNYKVETFKESYFENIVGYNKLMLSPEFYKRFLQYKFILIHQLDAYVFRDELIYWCEKNYDFIGAPMAPHLNRPNELQFLKSYSKILNIYKKVFNSDHVISNVGNGGLSLRKTRTIYWLLRIFNRAVRIWGQKNEDGFFRYWGNILHPIFRLAPDNIALRFSVETSPRKSLDDLKNTLPFGCHAFEKYEWETWKPFILEEYKRFEH